MGQLATLLWLTFTLHCFFGARKNAESIVPEIVQKGALFSFPKYMQSQDMENLSKARCNLHTSS